MGRVTSPEGSQTRQSVIRITRGISDTRKCYGILCAYGKTAYASRPKTRRSFQSGTVSNCFRRRMKPPNDEISGKISLITYTGIKNALDSGILGYDTVQSSRLVNL